MRHDAEIKKKITRTMEETAGTQRNWNFLAFEVNLHAISK